MKLPPPPVPPPLLQTFPERSVSALLAPLVNRQGHALLQASLDRLAHEFDFIPRYKSLQEQFTKAPLLLVNAAPGVVTPRSLPPNVKARLLLERERKK